MMWGNKFSLLQRTSCHGTAEMAVYFNITYNYMIDDVAANSFVMRTLGNEKIWLTATLADCK
jgi:hypothetical protein